MGSATATYPKLLTEVWTPDSYVEYTIENATDVGFIHRAENTSKYYIFRVQGNTLSSWFTPDNGVTFVPYKSGNFTNIFPNPMPTPPYTIGFIKMGKSIQYVLNGVQLTDGEGWYISTTLDTLADYATGTKVGLYLHEANSRVSSVKITPNPQFRTIFAGGDSIMHASAIIMDVVRASSQFIRVFDEAVGGTGTQAAIDRFPNLEAHAGTTSTADQIGWYFGGGNDIGGNTPEQSYALIQSYWAKHRTTGRKVMASTITARPAGNGGAEAWHQTLNGYIRAGWVSQADGLCDFGADPIMGLYNPDPNFWQQYWVDGIHPNAAGQARLGVIAVAAFKQYFNI